MELTTTLDAIRACHPCESGWNKLLKHLGKTKADNAPLPFSVILTSNGLDDALWCCQCAPQYSREWRLFAVWCALQVKHLMIDRHSLNALEVAERHANGQATDAELDAAKASAWTAAWTASRDASWTSVKASAGTAAWTAARDASWTAAKASAEASAKASAWDSAWASTCAASWTAAWTAARDAAWTAARDAAGAAQKTVFLWIVTGGLAEWEKR